MRRVLVLYNENAGHGRIGQKIDRICATFADGGCEVVPRPLRFDENPFEAVSDVELVVACGGDGTLNFVVNAMKSRGLDLPLGIIPSGTANDFARLLGLSDDAVTAARDILYGVERRVDCGRVNGQWFVNIFSFGLFTTTSQHTPDAAKHRVGKLAYLFEGAKELLHRETIPLHVRCDEGETDVEAVMVLVFNGETAGGFRLVDGASVEDGALDCVILQKQNDLRTLYSAVKYLSDRVPDMGVMHIRSTRFEFTSPLSPDTDMDGQAGANFPLSIECEAGGLRIIAPQG
ncbi:MAG: YegS/Rv2252/BmrU family lipid kinase [Alistipes sp.]|nr:YegS/Rv2252/BmrU family lipid kinase [Alistipes sp.]